MARRSFCEEVAFSRFLYWAGEEIQQFETFRPFPGVEQLLEVPPGEQHERYVEDKTSLRIALLAGNTVQTREIVAQQFQYLILEQATEQYVGMVTVDKLDQIRP